MQKHYIGAQELLEDSVALGHAVYASGFEPSFILAVWRGGVPIGIAVQEYLAFRGINSDHIAIRTSSYQGIDQQSREVRVYGLNYIVKNIDYDDRLLIVDDVYDTGRSIAAIIDELGRRTRQNMPHDIRIAVPYYKPTRLEVGRKPDYVIHEVDSWLKFPHSLEGLSNAEIAEHRPDIYSILREYLQ